MNENTTEIVSTTPSRYGRKYGRKIRLISVDHLDGRTLVSRQVRRLIREFEAAVEGKITAAMRDAITRAAVLSVLAADCRARRLAGDMTISLDDLVRLDHAAAQAVRRLGLDRRPEPAKPTLAEYLARKNAAPEATP
jgi:hypothetical protein